MLHRKTCKLPVGCVPASLVWAASTPTPHIVNVRVLRQLVQAAIDVSFPFLHPKTLPHKENVNYRQQSIAYNVSEKDKVK